MRRNANWGTRRALAPLFLFSFVLGGFSVPTRTASRLPKLPPPSIRYVGGRHPYARVVDPWPDDGRLLFRSTPRGKVYVRLVNHYVRSPIDNAEPTMQTYAFIVNSPRSLPVRFTGGFTVTALTLNGRDSYHDRRVQKATWKDYAWEDGAPFEMGTIWLPGGRNVLEFVRP